MAFRKPSLGTDINSFSKSDSLIKKRESGVAGIVEFLLAVSRIPSFSKRVGGAYFWLD